MEVTARADLLALVASTPRGGATVAGDPRVTLAIAMRLALDPADLALALDVAAAAVAYAELPIEFGGDASHKRVPAAFALSVAIAALTPGARALLQTRSIDVEED